MGGARPAGMVPIATRVTKPATVTTTPSKALPAQIVQWELKVLYREQYPKINVSFAAYPTTMLSALSMCKVSLLSRSGLVSGHLAPNVLLNAPVEP